MHLASNEISDLLNVAKLEKPNILQQSKIKGSLVYSENAEFKLEGVTLNPNYKEINQYNVIIDSTKTANDQLTVTLNGGVANGTVLSIAAPIKATITYNPSNETKINKDITATISFNRNNVTITNNEGKNAYTFTENGEFIFEYTDVYGFEGTTTVKIENIDKKNPEVKEI